MLNVRRFQDINSGHVCLVRISTLRLAPLQYQEVVTEPEQEQHQTDPRSSEIAQSQTWIQKPAANNLNTNKEH